MKLSNYLNVTTSDSWPTVLRRITKSKALIVAIGFAAFGSLLVVATRAATQAVSLEAESGILNRGELATSDAAASGGKAVKFGPPAAPPDGSCIGAPNTPGGADPWGGCFPGQQNTGPNSTLVTAKKSLTNYAGTVDADGICTFRDATVTIDSKTVNCDIVMYNTRLTITNSIVNGFVFNNDEQNANSTILLEDTVVNSGMSKFDAVGYTEKGSITVRRSNIRGNQHSIHCNKNCTVEDSWLHDNYDGPEVFNQNQPGGDWHENSFISNGGSNHVLRHNSAACKGACSSDINLNSDGNQTNALVERNLLVAAPTSSSCLYAVPSPVDGTTFQFIKIIENIFQRGANGKCGGLDPVNGPFTVSNTPGANGYGNEWRGNKWSDGATLNP